MENKIKRMYFKDCAVLLILVSILGIILFYIMTGVVSIAPNYVVKLVIALSGITVGIFALASAIAVLVHLKKSQTHLYTEEIMSIENIS